MKHKTKFGSGRLLSGNPVSRDVALSGLYHPKVVKTKKGKGSYTRNPKHKGQI